MKPLCYNAVYWPVPAHALSSGPWWGTSQNTGTEMRMAIDRKFVMVLQSGWIHDEHVWSWQMDLTWRIGTTHDDVIKWKPFPGYWPLVRGIHRSPVNSPHKGHWRGALIFSLICAWINRWVNNGEAGDLRRYYAHYDVIVMQVMCLVCIYPTHATVLLTTLHHAYAQIAKKDTHKKTSALKSNKICTLHFIKHNNLGKGEREWVGHTWCCLTSLWFILVAKRAR